MKRKYFMMFGAALLMVMNVVFPNFTISSLASTEAVPASKDPETIQHGKKHTFALFKNPILGDGADPWVVKHTDGYYYYTHTTGGNITIWKSKTLTGLTSAPQKIVWSPEENAPNGHHIWAPELHFIDGHWYIYFAASAGDMEKQRMYVLKSEGEDPWGPYSYPAGTNYGKIEVPTDKWSIDATILEYTKELYLVWSGWEGDVNVSQNIYIASMENPWTLSGDRVEISRPELDWEKIGFPHINEGPQILKNKQGKIFILYSASGSWTDDYSLGMLTFNGKDPLNPLSWEKNQTPVFQKNTDTDVYGPGHSSFVKSPDGKQDWIVYHAAKFKGGGWTRNIRMQEFIWNKDGSPNFGTPVSTNTLIRVPSGESKGEYVPSLPGLVHKYEAEDALVHNARVVDITSASGGKKVGYMDFEDSYVEFEVEVPPNEYTLVVSYSNGMGQQTLHNVMINNEFIGPIEYESYGWDNWRNAQMDVKLDTEQNTIRISKGHLYTEIDYIELIPKETTVLKYEAEFANLHKAEIINDSIFSNGQFVRFTGENGGFLQFTIEVPKTGIYEMKTWHVDDQKEIAQTRFSKLKQGKNKIMIQEKEGMQEIDYFTLEYLEKRK